MKNSTINVTKNGVWLIVWKSMLVQLICVVSLQFISGILLMFAINAISIVNAVWAGYKIAKVTNKYFSASIVGAGLLIFSMLNSLVLNIIVIDPISSDKVSSYVIGVFYSTLLGIPFYSTLSLMGAYIAKRSNKGE